ncbi:MAG: phosphate regulon sensor histidine kinase PhoR [Zoogloeaceae bacterium]|jgi:two-component system phosphate regulon sensor histidine kinase PhoR|nr:phosphate regulon sensor histidine kinase PhoR [Zoogloeaceae bacterium]
MPLLTRLFLLVLAMSAGAGVVGLFWRTPLTLSLGIVAGSALGLYGWLARDNWCAHRWLAWLRALQNTPTATPPRLSGIWRQATDRMERLLRQQRQRHAVTTRRLDNLREALEASPNGVIMLNKDCHIKWLNQPACRHFGLDEQRDIEQSVTHLIRDPAFVAYLAERDFDQAITLTSPVSTDARPLRLSVHIYPYSQKRLLILSTDITAFEQAEAMRRDFIANVSHELRTPLTVLSGFIETLQTLPLTEEERGNYLARMARNASRMQNLIADLLTLSRLEGKPSPGLTQWTSARALLATCESEARALSALITQDSKAHHLSFPDQDALDVEIAGQSDELQSAFTNLISNAIHYTPPGGRVEIHWQATPDGASFSVRDSGPGIAPEHIPRLTERFYRVDAGRSRESGGTGLGLAIVKHVLKHHDATLEIASTPGKGSCFTVRFPAYRIRGLEDGSEGGSKD